MHKSGCNCFVLCVLSITAVCYVFVNTWCQRANVTVSSSDGMVFSGMMMMSGESGCGDNCCSLT